MMERGWLGWVWRERGSLERMVGEMLVWESEG
jgi:hypothetical protein